MVFMQRVMKMETNYLIKLLQTVASVLDFTVHVTVENGKIVKVDMDLTEKR